jgi:hypothetical protein
MIHIGKMIIHDTIVSLLELFIITKNGVTFIHPIFNKNESETIHLYMHYIENLYTIHRKS